MTSQAKEGADAAAITPELLAALSARPDRAANTPAARPFSSFADNLDALRDPAAETNKLRAVCPREGCGSVVFKAGVGKFVEAPSVQLDPPTHDPPAPLARLPEPPAVINWWLLSPNPMVFENVAFSRPAPAHVSGNEGAGEEGKKVKFLACAECELGPFGWCEDRPGVDEFWIAVERVAYR